MSEKIEPAPDWALWKRHLIVCADCTAAQTCAEGRAILGPNAEHDDAPWLAAVRAQRRLSPLEWARENLDPALAALPTIVHPPTFDVFVTNSIARAQESLDRMPEKIEPALSAEEWAAYRRWSDAESALDVPPLHVVIEDFSAAGAIAAYNDMLPDSDPRKITREKIELLRMGRIEQSEGLDDPDATAALQAFADALQSYLPPEK